MSEREFDHLLPNFENIAPYQSDRMRLNDKLRKANVDYDKATNKSYQSRPSPTLTYANRYNKNTQTRSQ